MRIAVALVAAIAAFAVSASVGASSAPPLVGVRWVGETDAVVQRFEPSTLRPRGAARRLGIPGWLWSWSPDRTRIAFAADHPRRGPALVVLDASTLQTVARLSGTLELGGAVAGVQAITWLPGDRLLALTWSDAGSAAHLVDVRTRVATARIDLRGTLVAGTTTPRGLVGVLAPTEGIGPARLVAVDRELHTTDVVLDRVRAGIEGPAEGSDVEPFESTSHVPALAVDPSGGRAIVVGYREPIAEVDLDTGAVAYHPLALRTPARVAKTTNGPSLRGFWLGPDAVAVTGMVYEGLDGDRELRETPLGLQIVDLRTWQARVVDPAVSWLSRSGSYLVWVKPERGLAWYAPSGRRVGSLFGSRRVADVAATPTRALVRLTGDSRVALVDLRSGKVLDRRAPEWAGLGLPTFLVTGSTPVLG